MAVATFSALASVRLPSSATLPLARGFPAVFVNDFFQCPAGRTASQAQPNALRDIVPSLVGANDFTLAVGWPPARGFVMTSRPAHDRCQL